MKIAALKKALTMPKSAKRTHTPRSTPSLLKKGDKAVTEAAFSFNGWTKSGNSWLDKKQAMRATYNAKIRAYIVRPTRMGMKSAKKSS